ncbi:activator of HSP90 ATPase [Sphingobacterium puteale]|uniref:Activator of HSP90 ATPase n=1 Tax=Sphingobacterium puteale TaxID=2420510 RepID=A0A420W2A9_9SPHI|nr:SRPBCC domain-containing protein [Sphingobacterium puteale]RKO72725.1 activator of HSP90 ATPase [Sphingobacterium puteale]
MEAADSNRNTLVSVVLVERPIEDVWEHWTGAGSIKQWNIPFDDWHCPAVTNDFREGGNFNFRMERMEDGEGFDYRGVYDRIVPFEYIESTSAGRNCIVEFQAIDNNTILRETFEPDKKTPLDLQQKFTDSVLINFKKFVESR